jgi:hypothetical protein
MIWLTVASAGLFEGVWTTLTRVAALAAAIWALVMLVRATRHLWLAHTMRQWQQVAGLLLVCQMRQGKRIYAEGCRLYEPDLRFSYTVNGQSYEGRLYSHHSMPDAETRASQFIATAREGTAVQVHYNPRNPAEALLERLSCKSAAIQVACSAALLASAVLVALGTT